MCYPCDRGIVLPICPGYTNHSPGMNPGAIQKRPLRDPDPISTFVDGGGPWLR